MEQFWAIFWSALGTAVAGLMAWLTSVIIKWLNTKIKDNKVAGWAAAIAEIVFKAVEAVSQEFVSVLKKNGAFDEAAQKEAKEKAYNIIVSQLNPELTAYVQENFGDMKDWIFTQIEACLYQLKR